MALTGKAARKAAADAELAKRAAEKAGSASQPQPPKEEAAANANGKTTTPEEAAASEPPAAPVITPPPAEAPKADAVEPQMNYGEIEGTVLNHEERIDNLEELTTELHQALDKALEGGQSPAEARLGALFELKLKTAGTKLGAEVGNAASQAVERSTLALGKSGDALGKATEAVAIASSAKEAIDQVIGLANDALDGVKLVQEAVEEMRQIGEFVAETKEAMSTLAEELRAEMGALREEISAIRSANAPTPQPGPPVEVAEEEVPKLRPWQKKG